ncbi:MAG: Ig-like domain-containing protein [Tunicatimonas sp.]
MGYIPSVLRQWYYVFTLVGLLIGQRVEAASKYAFEEHAPPRLARSEQTQTITTIWEEDFESSAGGDVTDTGPTAWSITSSSSNNTGVEAISATAKILASKNDVAVWTSQSIDISAHSNVKIAVDLSSTGGLEDDDYLQVYYQLDSDPQEIPLLNGRWFGSVGPTTAMIGDLNGSSVRIIVKFRTDDAAEEYAVDNVRVFTEPSGRYSIIDGNWNDGSTWSYTAAGAACGCIPDLLSDTYTDGRTVSINQHGNTRSLTVNSGGTVRWISPGGKNLRLWGNARLDVELGGVITKGASDNAYLSFNQWNYRLTHSPNQTPAALGYPGVNVVVNVDQPTSFLISEIQINAAGDFAIQGTGNIETTLDLNTTHQANIANDLVGTLIIGDDLKMEYPGASFTNNQSVQIAEDLRVSQANAAFTNNGNLSVGIDIEMSGANTTFINNVDLTVDDNVVINSSGAMFTNIGDMVVDNTLFIDEIGITFVNDGNLTTRVLTIDQPDNTFTNQGNLEVSLNLILDANNNLLTNSTTGIIEIINGTLQLRGASEVVNEGMLKTLFLATNAISTGGGEITNRQTFTVDNDIYNYGKPLTVYNYGVVDINRDILAGADDKLELYNYENANWYFGGGVSSLIKLYAGALNNTIHYDGSGNQTIITPQDAYWHLTLANAGTTNTTSTKTPSGSALDINGDLTIEDNPAGQVLFDASPNNTNINLAGDWWRKAAPAYVSGSTIETVTFDGGNDQRARTYERFLNVEIDKTGQLLVEAGSSVANEATFTQGVVVAQNNQPLVFRPAAQAIGASDASHVVGPVTKQGSANFTFPVGDGTNYRPLTLDNLSAPSDFTAEYHRANPTSDGYSVTSISSPLLNVSTCEYWEVARTNGTAEAFVTLTWDDTSCPVDLTDLTIVRWDGTQWLAVPSTASGTAGSGSITTNTRLSAFGVFTLTERNDVPVASSDTATTQENTSVEISVPQNDTDRNGIDPASVNVVAPPPNGTITTDPATGAVTYTPATDFSGTDSFRYTIQDIKGLASAEATVTVTVTADEPTPTVTVNTAPVAQPDAFVTNEDQPLGGNLASNDTDQEQDALLFSLDSDHQAAHGTAIVNPSGTFVYTPDSNFFGNDQFVYTLCDDGEPSRCDTARVTFQVLPINDAPVAADDAFTVVENDTIIGNVATNDTDLEGDPMGDAVLLSAPANGEVTLEPSGRFTYQPDPHYVGVDQFSYRICDAQAPPLCDEAVVNIQVQAGLLNVPKAFSPNQDQINDVWIIPGIRAYPNNTVTVFNRWGNAIYRARGYNNQTTYWQGTASEGIVIGNQPLPDGTYFYVIDLGEGKKPMSGYVLLKR